MPQTYELRGCLYAITVLLVFQFVASALARAGLSFSLLLCLSLFFALALCHFLFRRRTFSITTTRYQIFAFGMSLVLTTVVFYYRLNWHLFDVLYPAGLLNMTQQVASGRFPVSFMSFPEFPANYHQGFVFVSGIVSYLGLLPPESAMRVTYLFCFGLSVILFQLFCLSCGRGMRDTSRLTLLFLFSASFAPGWTYRHSFSHDWHNYLTVFEYLASSSTALAVPLLFLVLLFLRDWTFTMQNVLALALLILISSTVSATLYLLLFCATGFVSAEYFVRELRKSCSRAAVRQLGVRAGIVIPLALGVLYLPRFVPSVFLRGEPYEVLQLSFRFLLPTYLSSIGEYLRLCGPVVWPGLLVAIFNLRSSEKTDLFLSCFFLVSFLFPFFFWAEGIGSWDNNHKFCLMSMISACLLLVSPVRAKSNFLIKRHLGLVIVFCFVVTAPTLINLFVFRLSISDQHAQLGQGEKDLVDWLKKQPLDIVLLPYDVELYELGASAPVFIRNHYSLGFLLSKKIEREYGANLKWWESESKFKARVRALGKREYIICPNSKLDSFLSRNATGLGPRLESMSFDHFTLFR